MCLVNVGERHDPEINNDLCDTRFLTQNCRGLNNLLKRNKVFNNFKNKADIIFVQESHSTKAIEASWKKMWGGEIIFSHGTSASRGCMILFKACVDVVIHEKREDPCGRYIFLKCTINGKKMFLINVYAPNTETEHFSFMENFFNTASDFHDDEFFNVVAGGDWNFIEDLEKDKKGGLNKLLIKSVTAM